MLRNLYLLLLIFFTRFELFLQEESEQANESDGQDQLISKTEEKVMSTIFKDYNSRTRPCGKAVSGKNVTSRCGPTEIAVSVYLRSVDEINDKDMSYDLQMIFRQSWMDKRLSYKKQLGEKKEVQYLAISPDDNVHRPWLPDTFFINEKEGYRHVIDKGNVMLRITPEGKVTYSFRVTLTLACQMDFSDYPLDEHKCGLDISSYGNTIDRITYKWREGSAVLLSTDFKNNVPSFEFEQVKRDFCEIKTTTGAYGCLRLSIYFKRIFSYAQFIHLYLPGFILVCVSWLAFWLSPQAIISRTAFGLVCFLTLILHSTITSPTLPPTSTTRSCDFWFTICLCFVVCSILQLVIIHRMCRKEQLQTAELPTVSGGSAVVQPLYSPTIKFAEEDAGLTKPMFRIHSKKSIALMPKKSTMPEKKSSIHQAVEPTAPLIDTEKEKEAAYSVVRTKDNFVVRKWRKCTRSQKFDIICRILFPLAFFFFNIIYWSSLHF